MSEGACLHARAHVTFYPDGRDVWECPDCGERREYDGRLAPQDREEPGPSDLEIAREELGEQVVP